MRLLFLSHRLPYPPHKGEKIRSLNILRHLAVRHEVHLGTLVDEGGDMAHLSRLRPHVRSLVVERLHPRVCKPLALAALLGPHSITAAYFHSAGLQRRLDELIERERIEAVFCSSSPMAEYVFRSRHAGRLRSLPKVMDLIDVDSHKWGQYAQASGRCTAWLYRREARCLAALERRIAREFDRVLVVSEAEKAAYPGSVDVSRVAAMSNGVDLEFFAPDGIAPGPAADAPDAAADPMLVFTGVMDYRPNVEGVRWFAERVLPRIQSAAPTVRFYIVGNRPTPAVRHLSRRPGIVVTGFVPDVREYLARAAVCVAPLSIARGIQNKVLEAMAMARPVVATLQAFEGIDAQPGRDLIVAADEASFATAVIGLLADPAQAARIGRSARARVEQRYSWAANLRLLDELFPSSSAASRRCGQGAEDWLKSAVSAPPVLPRAS